jgi:hypothetical protein
MTDEIKEERARLFLKMMGTTLGVVYQSKDLEVCDRINFAGESFDLAEALAFLGRKPITGPFLTKNVAHLERAAENRQKLANILGKSLLFFQKYRDPNGRIFYKKRYLVCHSQESAFARFIILPLVNHLFYKRYIKTIIRAEKN